MGTKWGKKWSKHIIHGGLECGWQVDKSKGHDYELVVAIVSSESPLVNVTTVHSNLMVLSTKIQLGKNYYSSKLI